MKKPDGHPDFPVWKLERYLLGELPAAEMRRIDGAMRTDPDLADWIRALETEYRDLADMHPTGRVAGRIWNRLRGPEPKARKARPASRYWLPAFALILLGIFLPGTHPQWMKAVPAAPGSEEGRLKGSLPGLYLYRKAGEGARPLKSGDRVRPGELIQMYYDAAGRGHGAIFSIDGEGQVTWHLPDAGMHSGVLAAGGKVPLGFAFELDSTAGYECFFFVAADKPFDLEAALGAIPKPYLQAYRGPEHLRLDTGIFQNSIVLMKDTGI